MPVAPKRTVGSSAERVRALPLHLPGGGDAGARGPRRGSALRRRARRGSARRGIGSPRGDGAEDASGSLKALVDELVARWGFVLATYRAHVAAEDEVVLPALAARVSNVAHAYELEHEAEIPSSTESPRRSTRRWSSSPRTTAGDPRPPTPRDANGSKARSSARRGPRTPPRPRSQHLAKEAAHLVPLMDGAFAPDEQTALVERFIASVPACVGPVLARGPACRGEQGPLRTLIASWLSSRRDGGGVTEERV